MSYRSFAIALLLLIIAGFWLRGLEYQRNKLPVYSQISDFQFVDSNEQPFSKQDLLGSVSVINFFFTSCPVSCPAIMSKIEYVRSKIKDTNGKTQFVSISVDPEHDTAAVLANYSQQKLNAASNWHLLTASSDQILKFSVESLKLGTAEIPDLHSTRLALIDQKARVRGYYQSQEQEDLRKLGRDIELLLQNPES